MFRGFESDNDGGNPAAEFGANVSEHANRRLGFTALFWRFGFVSTEP